MIKTAFYMHGFASEFSPKKQKIIELSKALKINGITVDYTKNPQEIFDEYCSAIKDFGSNIIIGTSLGGFYAAWVGSALSMPFLAINPAINPGQSLRRYIGQGTSYTGESYSLNEDVVNAYARLPFRMDGPGEVILDEGDELLSSAATIEFVGDKLPIRTYEGGSHRFDHSAELAQYIAETYL